MAAPRKKSAPPRSNARKGKQRKEKLIVGGVHGELVGTTWVDRRGSISERLVDEVTYKANCLESFYVKTDGTEESYSGQVGFIRGERLSEGSCVPVAQRRRLNEPVPLPRTSNWKATPVTALHNVTNKGFAETYQSTKVYTSTRPSRTSSLVFSDGGKVVTASDELVLLEASGQDEALTWDALDKTIGNTLSDPAHLLTKKPLSFEKVPDEFELEIGQKIGTAVFRTFEITPEDAVAAQGTNMEEIYGPMFNTCIYTGEITEIHTEKLSFEHSINAFCGCSGAIIFLLDTDQIGSASGQSGKALGVHVGGHPDDNIRANVAFRI